jgi:hypothetical protein
MKNVISTDSRQMPCSHRSKGKTDGQNQMTGAG